MMKFEKDKIAWCDLCKFLVLKIDDLNYLSSKQLAELALMFQSIEDHRVADGRKFYNEYVVINKDEPYIDQIIKVMKANGHWEEQA